LKNCLSNQAKYFLETLNTRKKAGKSSENFTTLKKGIFINYIIVVSTPLELKRKIFVGKPYTLGFIQKYWNLRKTS